MIEKVWCSDLVSGQIAIEMGNVQTGAQAERLDARNSFLTGVSGESQVRVLYLLVSVINRSPTGGGRVVLYHHNSIASPTGALALL